MHPLHTWHGTYFLAQISLASRSVLNEEEMDAIAICHLRELNWKFQQPNEFGRPRNLYLFYS
jgi:hypothetical protein